MARHVPEHHGEPAVAELEEVEDVAPDVDLRRDRVGGADLEPRRLGPLAREQRALHGVRELLLLLVQARAVERDGRVRRDPLRALERRGGDRPPRPQREEGQDGEELRGRVDGHDRPRPALLEERREERQLAAEAPYGGRIEPERPALPEQPPDRARRERLGAEEDRLRGVREPVVGDPEPSGHEHLPPLVGHRDQRRINVELADDRVDDGLEHPVDRCLALAERLRDRVEGAELRGCAPLPPESGRQPFLLLLRLLVQPRVLHRHGDLARQRGEQGDLSGCERPAAGREDADEADRDEPEVLVVDPERDGDGRVDFRLSRGGGDGRELRLGADVVEREDGAGARLRHAPLRPAAWRNPRRAAPSPPAAAPPPACRR